MNNKLFKIIYDIYCFKVDKNQKLVKIKLVLFLLR